MSNHSTWQQFSDPYYIYVLNWRKALFLQYRWLLQ